jgi:ubiquinone/menaquinone biosynthesis C-methylase UbiE
MLVLEEIIENSSTYSLDIIQSKLSIHSEIMDATKLKFEDNFFQLVHSNNTFEHIYPSVLASILVELNRVKSSRGLMSHFVDMTDHYSHMDSTISNFNFLKFSDKLWSWIDNSIQPMNRWRVNDYKTLYQKNNIDILEIEKQFGDKSALANLKLDSMYSNHSFEDLLVTHAYFSS